MENILVWVGENKIMTGVLIVAVGFILVGMMPRGTKSETNVSIPKLSGDNDSMKITMTPTTFLAVIATMFILGGLFAYKVPLVGSYISKCFDVGSTTSEAPSTNDSGDSESGGFFGWFKDLTIYSVPK